MSNPTFQFKTPEQYELLRQHILSLRGCPPNSGIEPLTEREIKRDLREISKLTALQPPMPAEAFAEPEKHLGPNDAYRSAFVAGRRQPPVGGGVGGVYPGTAVGVPLPENVFGFKHNQVL